MRLQALRVLGATFTTRIGQITSFDPNRWAVKCTLQPDMVKTGWLPLASAWVGNGWGMFAAPAIGQTIEVSFIEGAFDAGTAELRLFTTADQPLPAPAGEFWLVHKNGQFLKLTNDGRLTVSDGQGATLYLDGSGKIVSGANQWTHTGPVHFTDNVQVDKTLTANTDVIGGGKSLKSHEHSGVQSGGSNTGPPV